MDVVMTFEDVQAVLNTMRQYKQNIGHQLSSQDFQVGEWFAHLITSQYNRARSIHRLPAVNATLPRHQLIDYIRQDYQQGDRVLEAWSVMFVRYSGALDNISVEEHKQIAQTTERTLRCRQTYGQNLIHMHILMHQ